MQNKSYEYLRGGKPTVLVLEQVDNKRYTKREIAREDDTDYMIIEWKSGDYRWGGYDTDYYVFIRDNKTDNRFDR